MEILGLWRNKETFDELFPEDRKYTGKEIKEIVHAKYPEISPYEEKVIIARWFTNGWFIAFLGSGTYRKQDLLERMKKAWNINEQQCRDILALYTHEDRRSVRKRARFNVEKLYDSDT